MLKNLILKSYRKVKYLKLNIKRSLYCWEILSFYKGRITIHSKLLFEEYFKIFMDNSNSKIEIGRDTFFKDYCSLVAYENGFIKIGHNVFFNQSCSINSLLSIEIGDNCLFGENVKIYDHNHKYKDAGLIRNQGYTKSPVKIGANCWIGSNTTILKGVTIGNNCIIGAGAILFKSLPDNSLITSQTDCKKI